MYQLNNIPTETEIRKFLRHLLFGKNVFCPFCHSRKGVITSQKRYHCSFCRKRFSLLSSTWLANLKISLSQFWTILWCWTSQTPVRQAQTVANLSEKGVRRFYDLFRSHLPNDQDTLEHIVQLDEAYFGGMTGVALLMGKEKGTRKLAYKVLPNNCPNRSDAYQFIRECIQPGSQINTDSSPIYRGIGKIYPVSHFIEVHRKFEFSNTAEIEGIFGVLRTFIRRMYHHVTVDKLPGLVVEFYWRFSHPEIFTSPYSYLTKTLPPVPTG